MNHSLPAVSTTSLTEFFGGLSSHINAGSGKKRWETGEKIRVFFNNLHVRVTLHASYREKIQRRLADDFNLLDWIAPDETKLSSLLAELLRPYGSHGQSFTFLALWLKMMADNLKITGGAGSLSAKQQETIALLAKLSTDHSKLLTARVETEVQTRLIEKSMRRLDIRIHIGEDLTIGIENKFGAADQEEQISDYIDHLKNENKKHFILVYLSDGSNPAWHSIQPNAWEKLIGDGHAASFSHRVHTSEWLASCINHCEAEKIRFLLKDFLSYLGYNSQPLI